MLHAQARAKVNLFLHVRGRRPDGYHLLESLVTFADAGDDVSLTPGGSLALSIDGPFAAGLEADDGNLVLRAARSFVAHTGKSRLGHFHLHKALPVASGIGGGSADAAAALRLLAEANGLAPDDHRVMDCAAGLGADVPMCIAQQTRLVSGIGHEMGPVLATTPVAALLVNPGIGVATADTFRRIGLEPGQRYQPHRPDYDVLGMSDLATTTRNDLQPFAEALVPAIADVISALAGQSGCRLARMSGSGATCFALFESATTRDKAAALLSARYPGWWVCAVMLPVPEGALDRSPT